MKNTTINGFSKLTKTEKIKSLEDSTTLNDLESLLSSFWHTNPKMQRLFEEFSENTLSNYYLPYNIAPNFLINEKLYHIPMVIEESSVVAAASNSAKFWAKHGGFQSNVISTKKLGHIHFMWKEPINKLEKVFPQLKEKITVELKPITEKMEKRGGGVTSLKIKDLSAQLEHLYQLEFEFETKDAMGANFINSCLEKGAETLNNFVLENFKDQIDFKIIISILSNYTPECLVECLVEADIDELAVLSNYSGKEFADRFETAVKIAQVDPYRATTHNKGIFNGIDAVVLATGNDFRAVEACGHAYASKSGKYASLTDIEVKSGKFKYTLKIPMALGTVGGLTSLHPLAKLTMEILGKPSASELMNIAASVGLANNFSAVRALISKGIQPGHMKMHLNNILNQLSATEEEKQSAIEFFKDKTVSFSNVESYLTVLRT